MLRDAADVLGASKIPAGSLKKSLKSPEVQNAAVQEVYEKKWLLR